MRVTKFDPRAAALADRHYSRGAPGTPQFLPSGRTVALLTEGADAVWGTSWQVGNGVLWATHDWPRAWNCSIFRNESAHLSSDLIREAVAATRALWGDPPEQGFVTFVDVDKVRRKRDPGRCFVRAGWRRIGWTRSGKLVLQLAAADFPDPDPAARRLPSGRDGRAAARLRPRDGFHGEARRLRRRPAEDPVTPYLDHDGLTLYHGDAVTVLRELVIE